MKPFVLISSRPEPELAAAEHASFLHHCGLAPEELVHVRVDRGPLPRLDLDTLSGILVAGSPFNSSTPAARKPPVQRRIEAEISALLDEVVPADFPFFGACYGVATLGTHEGGTVDATYGENVSAPQITLTEAGLTDPILAGVPATFRAFVGHTEAIRNLPANAVLLATSEPCPVQMFRLGANMYATQFHPELDEPALVERVRAYDGRGYYPIGAAEDTLARLRGVDVSPAHLLLRRFVLRHAQD